MHDIEIVTHCWAGDHEVFAKMLYCQLMSLCHFPPKNTSVKVTVCFCREDRLVKVLLADFTLRKSAKVDIDGIALPLPSLGRRAIGRNMAALSTSASRFVWFTDCDHCFFDDVLDNLAEKSWPEGASMIYPQEIMIHRDHATGDALTSSTDFHQVPQMMLTDFKPMRYNRAIGGVQIVQASFARQHGYLNGHKRWQTPVSQPFACFRDDVAYRRFCRKHGPVLPVSLPGVYRIRHSTTTYQ